MEIATTAIKDMLESPYFSICTMDKVCKVIGADGKGKAYDMLQALHCVHYNKMSPSVRAALPELMREVFGTPAIDAETALRAAFKGIRA